MSAARLDSDGEPAERLSTYNEDTMYAQLAKMAFDLVNNSPIRGADAENTAAVKRWLQQIGNGQLVIAPPKLPRKTPEPAK